MQLERQGHPGPVSALRPDDDFLGRASFPDGLREGFVELRGVPLCEGRDRGSGRQGGKETENGEFHTLTNTAIVPPAFANDGEHWLSCSKQVSYLHIVVI